MTPLQESLSKCKVQGNVIFLPPISEGMLANYADVRKALLAAGSKYTKNSFVFPNDAQPYMDRLMGGEKVNIKKETQSFFTPSSLGKRMIQLLDIKDGMTLLEPEAGQGALIEEVYKAFPYYMKGPNDKPCVTVDYFELDSINQDVLSKKINSDVRWSSSTSFMDDDFLKADVNEIGQYDRIIANPPFSKNQDIDHIYQMFLFCKAGGRIVTMASKHWQTSSNKKEIKFAAFLDDINAEVIEIERGEFKESGTMISTVIMVINKPKL